MAIDARLLEILQKLLGLGPNGEPVLAENLSRAVLGILQHDSFRGQAEKIKPTITATVQSFGKTQNNTQSLETHKKQVLVLLKIMGNPIKMHEWYQELGLEVQKKPEHKWDFLMLTQGKKKPHWDILVAILYNNLGLMSFDVSVDFCREYATKPGFTSTFIINTHAKLLEVKERRADQGLILLKRSAELGSVPGRVLFLHSLAKAWNKQQLSPARVVQLLGLAQKKYDAPELQTEVAAWARNEADGLIALGEYECYLHAYFLTEDIEYLREGAGRLLDPCVYMYTYAQIKQKLNPAQNIEIELDKENCAIFLRSLVSLSPSFQGFIKIVEPYGITDVKEMFTAWQLCFETGLKKIHAALERKIAIMLSNTDKAEMEKQSWEIIDEIVTLVMSSDKLVYKFKLDEFSTKMEKFANLKKSLPHWQALNIAIKTVANDSGITRADLAAMADLTKDSHFAASFCAHIHLAPQVADETEFRRHLDTSLNHGPSCMLVRMISGYIRTFILEPELNGKAKQEKLNLLEEVCKRVFPHRARYPAYYLLSFILMYNRGGISHDRMQAQLHMGMEKDDLACNILFLWTLVEYHKDPKSAWGKVCQECITPEDLSDEASLAIRLEFILTADLHNYTNFGLPDVEQEFKNWLAFYRAKVAMAELNASLDTNDSWSDVSEDETKSPPKATKKNKRQEYCPRPQTIAARKNRNYGTAPRIRFEPSSGPWRQVKRQKSKKKPNITKAPAPVVLSQAPNKADKAVQVDFGRDPAPITREIGVQTDSLSIA